MLQAEIYEPDGEKPERAEDGGVHMVERQKRAVLVIIHERGVQSAAVENTRARETPNCRADEQNRGSSAPVSLLVVGGRRARYFCRARAT